MWWHVDEHVSCRHVVRHLEPQCDVCTRMKVCICARKTRCEGVLSTVSLLHQGYSWRCASQAYFTIFRVLTRRKNNTQHIYIYTYMLSWIIKDTITVRLEVWCVCAVYVVRVCLSAVCLHLINTCMKTSHSTCTCTVTLYVIETRTHKKSNCFFFFLK